MALEASYGDVSYVIGGRYLHGKTRHPLTVRYIGPLPPRSAPIPPDDSAPGSSNALWLGVEYDDPAHGKGHSGTYQGQQVFACRQEGAGAFIKLVPGALSRGRALVQAFEERYGSILPGAESQRGENEVLVDESVRLGTSGIVVEAPGMGRVQRKVGQLERLKEVGLEGEWVAELGGTDDQRRVLQERLRGVHLLNLSGNLLSSWDEVEGIVSVFAGLRTLILNHSRIPISSTPGAALETVSDSITELYLGDAGLSWPDACRVARLFPNLTTLHINDNAHIQSPLELDFRLESSRIQILSLASCRITSWTDVVSAVRRLTSLESLDLSRLPITSISPRPSTVDISSSFPALRSVILSDVPIRDWASIDNIAAYLPELRSLRIGATDTPLKEEDIPRNAPRLTLQMTGNDLLDRPILIAKLPSLEMLNSSRITLDERRNAEMSYVRQVSQLTTEPGEISKWGRYAELKEKHGIKDVEQPRVVRSDLRSKMITLNVIHAKREAFQLRILPSLSIVAFKRKIAKKMDRNPERLHIWSTIQRGEETIKNVEVHDGRDVEWWFSDGDTVLWTGGRVDGAPG